MKPMTLAFVLLSSAAWAQEGKVWTGAADDRWENPANWSPEGVPGRETTAYVGPVKTKLPVIRRTAVVRRLLVEEDAVLRIEGERTLYVTDRLEVNGRIEFGSGAVEVERALVVGPKGRIQAKKDDKETGKRTTATWTGGVSTDWGTAGNWSTGQVPTMRTTVVIPSVSTGRFPIVVQTAAAHDLTVAAGAVLALSSNSSATVGNLVVEGQVTVQPSAIMTVLGAFDMPVGSSAVQNNGTVHYSGYWTSGSTAFQTGTVVLGTMGFTIPEGNLSFTPTPLEHRKVWKGKPDGDWFDPKNWETGAVPGPEDDVVLKSDPILPKDAAIRSLTIESTGTLILRAKLSVKGDVDAQGEMLFEKGGEVAVEGLLRIKGEGRVGRR